MARNTEIDQKFADSFDNFRVPHDWQCDMYNYFVHGFDPGGFFTALLSNDLFKAAAKSHVLNNWNSIQALCLWLVNCAPKQSFGNFENVDNWLKLPVNKRRVILEDNKLLLTAWEHLGGTL